MLGKFSSRRILYIHERKQRLGQRTATSTQLYLRMTTLNGREQTYDDDCVMLGKRRCQATEGQANTDCSQVVRLVSWSQKLHSETFPISDEHHLPMMCSLIKLRLKTMLILLIFCGNFHVYFVCVMKSDRWSILQSLLPRAPKKKSLTTCLLNNSNSYGDSAHGNEEKRRVEKLGKKTI